MENFPIAVMSRGRAIANTSTASNGSATSARASHAGTPSVTNSMGSNCLMKTQYATVAPQVMMLTVKSNMLAVRGPRTVQMRSLYDVAPYLIPASSSRSRLATFSAANPSTAAQPRPHPSSRIAKGRARTPAPMAVVVSTRSPDLREPALMGPNQRCSKVR
eukprot:CAMPEP_0115331280 /NCGR_PEP_ID=MMETSP0270-20121206/86231_1 /TAXON_ID=71861 /ORGANISM="Scrippsiella trochoidea, Strain CCMP3099" /LENGTH=160 /DNA_ID=CAMNT_0002752061 /DNA_START=45 /DNA_END=523 /DNA_ORIENTATION=+